MKRTLAATAALVVGVSAAGLAWVQSDPTSTSKTVHHTKSAAFYAPSNSTTQDYVHFAHNLIYGTTWATALGSTAFEGEVKGVLTGLAIAPTGERQLVVTVVDDVPDVDSASVYVLGVLAATATRENGGVIERNGQAIATLGVLIPAGPPVQVEARWTSSSGVVRSAAVGQ